MQQRNNQKEADSDSNSSSPACQKPSSKKADVSQSHGKLYDEISTTDCVSYRLPCKKDDSMELPPLSILPQVPYAPHSPDGSTFTYATPPAPHPSHTIPEQQCA